jgi:uncharacterized protein
MLTDDNDATLLAVRVKPRASATRIAGERSGRLLIHVSAPPVESRANAAVCRLIAKTLGIANGRVTIASGERGRDKVIRIDGVSARDAAAKLGAG